MSATGALFTPTDQDTDLGVIGNRHLIAVQTVDIARLTTHPVPIVPGSFVAVTGQGPKADSNGSGKTTFLSAVSLLLCDAQWRLNADGRHATALLFQPESAGLSAASGSADHGFIIGVFARGGAGDESDLMTLWIRISRNPQDSHVVARYTDGLHVLHRETDQEQADQADERWNELPAKSECGSRTMAAKLYGAAPRCLAYLDTSVRPAAPSLLSQQMTQMSPALIGEALIALTGRDHLLDGEVRVRRRHAAQFELLARRERADELDRSREKDQLAELERRERARRLLRETDEAWERYLAQGLIEKTADHAEKQEAFDDLKDRQEEKSSAVDRKKHELTLSSSQTDLGDAAASKLKERARIATEQSTTEKEVGGLEATLKALILRRDELRPKAEGHDERSVEEHEEIVRTLEEAEADASLEHGKAKTAHDEAVTRLNAAREGREGLAGQALALLGEGEEPIAAVSILDVVAVHESRRAEWEPRLWRYRNAVAVAPVDEQRALKRLSALPGATIIVADGPLNEPASDPAPHGVESAVALSGFLQTLQHRQQYATSPHRVHDAELAEATLGGFGEPFTGRAARIALAEADVCRALAHLEALAKTLLLTEQAAERGRQLLAAARAESELVELRSRAKEIEDEIGSKQKHLTDLEHKWRDADAAYTEAKSALDNHESRLEQLRGEIQRLQGELGDLRVACKRAEGAVERVGLDAWQIAWGRPLESAIALVGAPSEEVQRSAAEWRNQAIGVHQTALSLFAVDSEYLPAVLRQLVSDLESSAAVLAQEVPDPQMYATHTRPLRDHLEYTTDTDAVIHDRIVKSQERRTREIAATRTELETLKSDLETQQELVEGSVERALQAIGGRLNELDQTRGQYGAKLEIDIIKPDTPDAAWEWRVTPKWRRSPGGGFVSYKEAANGAQVKVYAIQLVLAALLADNSVPGRLLILDELGNSLGDTNRKDVLAALHRVARDEGATILGTCQDSVIYDAAGVCGEVVWFYHEAATDAYNKPTRAWGFDPEQRRVELVAPWLQKGRPLD